MVDAGAEEDFDIPPLKYEGLDDDLKWMDGRRKRKQKHNQGHNGHGGLNVWETRETEGRRVRV